MTNSVTQILRNIGRVAVAVVLGLIVLNIAVVVIQNPQILPETVQNQPWTIPFINHTVMWVVSVLIILLLSKGRFTGYGFSWGKDILMKRAVLTGLATGVVFALSGSILSTDGASPIAEFSFMQTVIFVWLYASISEEIFTRGLIQGFLAPLERYGLNLFRVRITIPVLTSALFFSLIHLGLLQMGIDPATVLNICVFAFVIGIFAGYYREKTGSIIPAIIIHMFGNVGGTLTGLLIESFG